MLRGASCQSRWAKWFVPYQKGLVCYRSRGGYSQHAMGARLWWIGVRSEQTKWRIGALKRCETDGRKCQSAPMARIRRCERRGRYLVIATLAPIYLGLVRRRLSRGRTHLRSSKLSTARDTLNKSSRRCAPGSGASSGRWHLPSIEHTTTDDKCRAFLWSPQCVPRPIHGTLSACTRAGGELDHRDRE